MIKYKKYKEQIETNDSSQLLKLKHRQDNIVSALFEKELYEALGEECIKLKIIEHVLTTTITRELTAYKQLLKANIVNASN